MQKDTSRIKVVCQVTQKRKRWNATRIPFMVQANSNCAIFHNVDNALGVPYDIATRPTHTICFAQRMANLLNPIPSNVGQNIGEFTGRTWLLPKILQWYENTNDRKPGIRSSNTLVASMP
jgi:hypothetical protein